MFKSSYNKLNKKMKSTVINIKVQNKNTVKAGWSHSATLTVHLIHPQKNNL